jgi:hypothetical protein
MLIGGAQSEPKIVCQTWFESECNTTIVDAGPNAQDKANTWCQRHETFTFFVADVDAK